MKYYTFVFRDLDNNIVLVRPDQETKQLDYHIIDNTGIDVDSIQLNRVVAVEVNEPQEDIFSILKLFDIELKNQDDSSVCLAELADTDEATFRELVDRLYNIVLAKTTLDAETNLSKSLLAI
jgi:hypothetical protein